MYDLLPNQAYRTFFTVMAIVVVPLCCGPCCIILSPIRAHIFGIRVEADIRRDLFAHMQKLSYGFSPRTEPVSL